MGNHRNDQPATTARGGHPRPRSRPAWARWRALAVACLIAAAGAGCTSSTQPASHAAEQGAESDQPCDVTPVAHEVFRSVVTISVHGAGGGAIGSGEVLNSNGDILTNNHVIAGAVNNGSISVIFADDSSRPATLVGRDALTDLAVLRVAQTGGLKPIRLGSSDTVQVGQPVVVLGSPLGLLGTVTSGIVSAVHRTIQVPQEGSSLLVSAVQTDAAINPGNSGGAMVNCEGQLIGVPTAGASVPSPSGQPSPGGSIGIGFAIPVDLARTISDEIIRDGHATHAFFGLQIKPFDPRAAQEPNAPRGLYVASVIGGGPAARAGLRVGDVVTRLAGEPAVSGLQLQELSVTRRPNSRVDVEYWRSGRTMNTTVTLGAEP